MKNLHLLTKNGKWEIRVDYQRNDKTWSYLHYNQFSVGSASEEYPLTIGGFTGVGTNRFGTHPLNGMKFSTPDNDNDRYGVTVQLMIRVDGGTIAVTLLTSTDNHGHLM